jgi:hypothetical protein
MMDVEDIIKNTPPIIPVNIQSMAIPVHVQMVRSEHDTSTGNMIVEYAIMYKGEEVNRITARMNFEVVVLKSTEEQAAAAAEDMIRDSLSEAIMRKLR